MVNVKMCIEVANAEHQHYEQSAFDISRQTTTVLWHLYLKDTANYSFTRWNIKKTRRTTTLSITSCCENFTLNYFHSLYILYNARGVGDVDEGRQARTQDYEDGGWIVGLGVKPQWGPGRCPCRSPKG